jgi:branched-chain amino acid transport system permease protein
MAAIYAILALSLNLVLGYCGLLSLATPAFFGIGAYSAALLVIKTGLPWAAALPAAVLIGIVGALAIGIPCLRTNKHAFVIVTLASTLLLQLVAANWTDLTRGALGIADIPSLSIAGWTPRTKLQWYVLLAAVALACMALFGRIVRSRLGPAMIAARDDEVLATAAGMDVTRLRIWAFVLSGALAALAGALYAPYITYIDPGVFGFHMSEVLLIMVVIGGAGTFWGPILGAIVFTALPEVLRISPELRALLYGFLLFAAIWAFPKGIATLHWRRRTA